MPQIYTKSYHGAIFTANASGTAQSSRSYTGNTYDCSNNFYGYELKVAGNKFYVTYKDSAFKIKEVSAHNFVLTDSTIHESTDPDFINNITICNGVIYTILNKKIYKTNGYAFEFAEAEEFSEIRPYIPFGHVVHAIDQSLANPLILQDMLLVYRKFDVRYGLNSTKTINKISRIEDEVKLQTPTLFLKNSGSINNLNLFYKTPELLARPATLFTEGVVSTSNGLNFHIEVGNRNVLPLNLKTIDPDKLSNASTLFTYGATVSGGGFNTKDTTLFLSSIVAGESGSVPLVLVRPDKSDVSGTLSLNIVNQPKNIQENLSIFIQNNQLSQSDDISLFCVSVSGNVSNPMNLTLFRKGVGSGQEKEEELGLYMHSEKTLKDVFLYTDGVSGSGDSCTLVMPKCHELPSSNAALNVFGYSE
jgi:hypothetical protein